MITELTQNFFDDLLNAFYPIRLGMPENDFDFTLNLQEELKLVLDSNLSDSRIDSQNVSKAFIAELPAVKLALDKDIQAIYDGDPAADSLLEIILAYPGFYAISAYRIAHLLDRLGVKLIPRIITEHAHAKTGIDIHPKAKIGSHFCIDHGTGIVIGETAVIEDNVKLYQGVTLGALSLTSRNSNKKRHPTIKNNAIIYAQATILGGKTIVGENSIVGGNVWLTKSIPDNTKIYYRDYSVSASIKLNAV